MVDLTTPIDAALGAPTLSAPAPLSGPAQFGGVAQTSLATPMAPVQVAQEPTLGEVAGAYWRTETVAGSFLTHMGRRYTGEVDPNFSAWDHIGTLPAQDQDTALQYADSFSGLGSAAAVETTMAAIRAEQDDEYLKSQAGLAGTAVGIAVSLLDVSTLVPFVGAGAKVGLAARIAIGAANAAGTAALEESALQGTQHTRTALDSFLSVGTATVLGAGIGSFAKLTLTPAHSARAQAAMKEDLVELPLGPDLLDAGAAAVDPITRARAEGYRGVDEDSQGMNKTLFDRIPVLRRTAGYLAANTKNERVRKFLQMGAVTWGRTKGDDVAEMSAEEGYHLIEAQGFEAINGYRSAFNAYNKEAGGGQQAFGMTGALNRVAGRIRVSKQDFDFHVAERLEDPTYTPKDPALAAHVAAAADALAPVKKHLFEQASARGFFKTNKIEALEKEVAKLAGEAGALKGRVAEAADLGSSLDVEKVAKQLAKKEARLAKAQAEAADLGNHFTQSWVKSAIIERGLPNGDGSGRSMVDILARDFARTSHLDSYMLESAKRVAGDETPLDDLVDAFDEGGWDALPKGVRDAVNTNLQRFARESATKVVEQFRTQGHLSVGEFVNDSLEASNRFKGRKINLSKEGRQAMREEGFLLSNPEVEIMQYIRDVGAKVAVHEKYGTIDVLDPSKSALGVQIQDEYKRLIAAGEITGREADEEMKIASNLMTRLLNKHTQTDPNGLTWFGRNIRRTAQAAFLGGAGISQLADLVVTSLQMGVTGLVRATFLRSMKNTHAILRGLKDEQLQTLIVGLDSSNGAMRVMDATNMGTPVASAAARGIGTGMSRKITGMVDEGMEGVANAMSVLNLQHPMTVLMRAVSFENFNHLMFKATKNPDVLSEKDWSRLARMGLSRSDVARMGEMPTYEAAPGFHTFDTDAWADVKLRNKFLVAAHRNGSQSVVQVSKGMTPDFMDNELAKVVFQFQQFSYGIHEVALRQFFKGGVLPKDVQTASSMMLLLASGIVIDMAKEAAKGREVTPLSERFSTPARTFGTIYSAVDRGGMLAYLSPYTQIGMRAVQNATGADMFGQTGKFREVGVLGLATGPSGSILKHLDGAITSASAGDAKRAAYHAIRLMPFNNHFALDGAIRRSFGVN